MAAHMEAKQIRALAVVPYAELRNRLHSGDLFFASGDYLISNAIQSFTKSPWSHVGIVFRLDKIDRVLLLESVEDIGVRLVPLSKYLSDYADGKAYKGRCVLARSSATNKETVAALAKFGIDELTRPYDKDEIARIIARIALGRGKRARDREYICSELVHECFARAGKTFTYDERGFVSPENIWRDDTVSLVARIL